MSRTSAAGRRMPPPVDIGIVVALEIFVVGATTGWAHWGGDHVHPLGVPGYALLVAAGLPLLFRRYAPELAFVLSAGLVQTYSIIGYPTGPILLFLLLGLATLSFMRGVTRAAIVAGAVLVGHLVVLLIQGDGLGALPAMVGPTLGTMAVIAGGHAGRMRRGMLAAAQERGVEEGRRRAEEERVRIAREVHDVVAHSLAMINVQAGVAAHVADRRPEQAKEALLAIKEASRVALTDLRATLGVLRSGGDRAPTPGLERLPDLIATAAAAGIEVLVDGVPGDLPAPADVAAYRIMQESLTNVVRHANGATAVTIRFIRSDTLLDIMVRDNGSALPHSPTEGNGLRGMTERASALGGTLTAAPADGGGFEVHATLPLADTLLRGGISDD
ncbi:MAG TPA: sensor histidine kinase [Pseudonocardiaceae bacterium]|nr:sensor histidine kinase [Pseudonocardiaceae bacterium]